MPEFIIAYLGEPQAESESAGEEGKREWGEWLAGLGDAVVNPGTPMGPSRIVATDGSVSDAGSDRMTGFTIVNAPDLDAAVSMAQSCPFLAAGGALQVGQKLGM